MDEAPEPHGRFYRFIHHAAMSFPFLPILRVHRHAAPPEGQDPPPLADLHPGDVVEVAPVHILSPGDTHPETGAAVTLPTEVAVVVNSPHLELIPAAEATAENIGAALVQDPSGVVSELAATAPEGFHSGGVVPEPSAPGTGTEPTAEPIPGPPVAAASVETMAAAPTMEAPAPDATTAPATP